MPGNGCARTASAVALCSVMLSGCSERPSAREGGNGGWWVDVSAESGVRHTWRSGAAGEWRLAEIMGGGVALFDADADGDLDLVANQGVAGGTRFFRQDSPGRFVDASADAGFGDSGYGMGVAVGDVDNDGFPDVYLSNYGDDRLYRNLGGRFHDVTREAGIVAPGWSTSAAFCDLDLDGFLDLFVARYVDDTGGRACFDATGRPEYCSPQTYPPTVDLLFRNGGDGTFREIGSSAGLDTAPGPGLGVVCDDFDGDRVPDVYVANDGAANRLWIHDGAFGFRERAVWFGVAYNLEGRAEAGMGVLSADLDDDGHQDLFLTHLAGESHTLYAGRGGADGFDDRTAAGALAQPTLTATGFGTAAIDVELDGELDLVIANGRVSRGKGDSYAELDAFFLRDGGAGFVDAAGVGGDFTSRAEISRGLAVGDLDGDGDDDLVVVGIDTPLRVYENRAPRAGRPLRIRPRDGRRVAIGARVTLHTTTAARARWVSRTFGYLSSSEPVAVFGIPDGERVERVVVLWPGGAEESFVVSGETSALVEVARGEGRTER